MDEVLEVVPLSVELDTAQLDHRFDSLLDPAHTAVVAASADDALDSTFDGTGSDVEVTAKERTVATARALLSKYL